MSKLQGDYSRGIMVNPNNKKHDFDRDPGGPLTDPFDPALSDYNYKS